MDYFLKKGFILYFILLICTISGSTAIAAPNLASDDFIPYRTHSDKPMPSLKASTVEVPEYSPETTSFQTFSGVKPVSIAIPAINIEAPVENVGHLENGEMGVPSNIHTIGWYKHGAKPGESGNAVMAGHVDGKAGPGAFYFLKKLEKDDRIFVTGKDGRKLEFRVTSKQSYDPAHAPLEVIFGYTSNNQLNLITCTGAFNYETGSYVDRLVVYTELVNPD
ncbi:class F sortase [Halobacillus amylolyticus]|uniref:Class F sortase n=1 Tax=Halobacillus amylolyticus TaxID=2932259 RepID=A0ABY4HGP0_9BACI|nr:class F sortase [Halobacillus amylolyticus]UOR13458.1 class F sortase [Halobacillus amylolyticus]